MRKPRLLDLFCGAGGCAAGYKAAGFYVTGVDISPQPRYAGDEFYQGDALGFLELCGTAFDVIHASPPCQAYTTMTNRRGRRSVSPPLIADTIKMLARVGKPWVLENVPGARKALLALPTITLTGEMFGLRVHRPRLFAASLPLVPHPAVRRQANPVPIYGPMDGRRIWTRVDGTELRAPSTLLPAAEAMGIHWMTWDELREAVPPLYTEYIGRQLLASL